MGSIFDSDAGTRGQPDHVSQIRQFHAHQGRLGDRRGRVR
jgi:hypothetical protein